MKALGAAPKRVGGGCAGNCLGIAAALPIRSNDVPSCGGPSRAILQSLGERHRQFYVGMLFDEVKLMEAGGVAFECDLASFQEWGWGVESYSCGHGASN